MLRKLMAILSMGLGAQLLLPPIFVVPVSTDNLLGQPMQAAIAAELSDIRDRGYIIVGIKNNRPPLGFIDTDGNLAGFEVDIARRLATDIFGDENAVQFVPLSNVDRLNAVLDERVDIAIAAITLTEPRRRLVNFSDPYYLDGTAFLVRAPAEALPQIAAADLPEPNRSEQRPEQRAVDIQTLNDLRLGKVAVLNRSSSMAHVRYILPGAHIVGVDTYRDGQTLLSNGSVDAFAGDASVLTGWAHPQDAPVERVLADYELLPNVISAEPLAVALPKGTQYNDLQTTVNQSIRRWYAEEWLQERAKFWALPSGILSDFLDAEGDPGEGLDSAPGSASE